MADWPDDVTEEVSSSEGQQTHEVGESSRPPQTNDDIFRTQLVTALTMFTQVMQNLRFLAFLQPPLPSQQVGSLDHIQKPIKAQAHVIHTAESMETPCSMNQEQSIISDRDPRMTSLFQRGLLENMGTTLKFSSSFHPQTDGQSKEANSTILDLLKCYVSKHKGKWEQYLSLVEYAYNNTVHSSTGKVPFEIVEGGKKVPPILHTRDKIFEADKYVLDMDEMYKKVKVALEKTQAKQKKAVDRHRREVVFSLGDWVPLRFENARLKKMKGKERLFPKLSMCYYGPFQICDIIIDVAYRLKLPESWKIHTAFHVSLLRPYVGDVPEDMPAEDQPEVEKLDEILVPKQILAHKERKVKGKVARRYLVKFRNYPPMDAKWMEEGELTKSPTVLSLYLEAFGLQPTLTP
ncbi:hypothetical protein L7F22_011457 [Adiantum nelumboides]|nr:hypothetical protein [Adiantum nelumboides]